MRDAELGREREFPLQVKTLGHGFTRVANLPIARQNTQHRFNQSRLTTARWADHGIEPLRHELRRRSVEYTGPRRLNDDRKVLTC